MQLYAELLLHIRTITVSASLTDVSDEQTTARLSDDRLHFVLKHGGQRVEIRLPGRIDTAAPLALPLPSNASHHLTFRLPLDNSTGITDHLQNDSDVFTPWSANILTNVECMHCKTCRRNIVAPLAISVWKDLPSENWAEMMDFWHCHKPHVDGQSDQSSTKGYAAANHLTAQLGVGFVDTSTFVFSKKNCSSLKVANENILHPDRPDLVCDGCGTIIGVVDDVVSGWRLFKSQLALGFRNSVQLHQYPLELWVSAILLSAAEAQAVKKFIVHDSKDHAESLLIWIFTPDLWISSSEETSDSPSGEPSAPVRATKILWKAFDAQRNESVSNGVEKGPESIDLAPKQFQCLKVAISKNQSILPVSARQYRDWKVSFLHRFRPREIQLSSTRP